MEHFTKMATSYDVGELVVYRNQICLISEIHPTQGGYNTYFLEDIDEERTYVAFKHQLEKAIHFDILTLDDVVMTEPMVGPQKPGAGQISEAAITPTTNLETPNCSIMSIITPAIRFYRGCHSTYANGDGDVPFSNFDS